VENQLIEVYSESKPTSVKVKGERMNEVLSFYNLQPKTGFMIKQRKYFICLFKLPN
jgi:hypothetical protein